MGAVEFATTLAPGLRDVLLTGKAKETRHPHGPRRPAASTTPSSWTRRRPGRVVTFLDVTRAMADLARSGPIHSQSAGRGRGCCTRRGTAVHLVTLLEDLPVTETLEARRRAARRGPARRRGDRQPGAAAVAARPLGGRGRGRAGGRRADPGRARRRRARRCPPTMIDGLVAETVEHAVRVQVEARWRGRPRPPGCRPAGAAATDRRRRPRLALRAGRGAARPRVSGGAGMSATARLEHRRRCSTTRRPA